MLRSVALLFPLVLCVYCPAWDPPTDEAGFIAALRAEPDDDTRRLAFADYLDEHGRAIHANFIRTQIEMKNWPITSERYKELEVISKKIIKDHPHDILPRGLWEALQKYDPDRPRYTIVYERGFPSHIYLTRKMLTNPKVRQLIEQIPVVSDLFIDFKEFRDTDELATMVTGLKLLDHVRGAKVATGVLDVDYGKFLPILHNQKKLFIQNGFGAMTVDEIRAIADASGERDSLSLSFSGRLSNDAVSALLDRRKLGKLKTLELSSLSSFEPLNTSELPLERLLIVEFLHNLESFAKFKDSPMLPGLRELNVTFPDGADRPRFLAALEAMAENGKNLTEVKVGGRPVTEEQFPELKQLSKRLRENQAKRCNWFTDKL